MGEKIMYALLRGWVMLHAYLPMRCLYFLSDLLYVLVYSVVRYRVKVTRRNMAASFPELTEKERRALECRFYHHFTDYIVETIKLAAISHEELLRRAVILNPELVDRLMDEGHPLVIILMGHCGNWEWFTGSGRFFRQARLYQIYRPLSSKAFDRLFIDLRTRFGSLGIPKNDVVREMIRLKQRKERAIGVFIADQTPSKANLHYWTDFLHQDTPVLTGAERLARKLDLPVVYADVRQKARGYYTIEVKLITDKPKETPEFYITERYARLMEETILRDPADWLWTHRRWKHKHEVKA